jgi:hypothetical protein
MFPRKLMAKVLALRAAMGCNAQSFNFGSNSPMTVTKRRLPNFEACSVALFTSLALGGTTLPARSQVPSTPSSTSPRSMVPPSNSKAPLHGQLSRQEVAPRAAAEPVGLEHDARDKDGSISSPGFDESLK